MVNASSAVQFIVYLVVVGLVFWLLWWLLDYIAPPEPFHKVGRVVIAVLAVLCIINLLLTIVGQPLFLLR